MWQTPRHCGQSDIISTGYAHSSTQGEMSVAMTFTIAISVLRDTTSCTASQFQQYSILAYKY